MHVSACALAYRYRDCINPNNCDTRGHLFLVNGVRMCSTCPYAKERKNKVPKGIYIRRSGSQGWPASPSIKGVGSMPGIQRESIAKSSSEYLVKKYNKD